VPEEALRVELHARLGELMRRADLRALRDMADEAEDRFGPAPEPFGTCWRWRGWPSCAGGSTWPGWRSARRPRRRASAAPRRRRAAAGESKGRLVLRRKARTRRSG
jgi:hypothetical protein